MKKILYILLAVIGLSACKSQDPVSLAAFKTQETECLGNDIDGKMTLKVWAQGRNRQDAVNKAMKKAVYDVTFTGITAGNGAVNTYPVVDEANARQKYQDYFDKFFADGGAYAKYVTTKGQKKSAQDELQGAGYKTFGIIVVVDRSQLKKRYQSDNVIAQ